MSAPSVRLKVNLSTETAIDSKEVCLADDEDCLPSTSAASDEPELEFECEPEKEPETKQLLSISLKTRKEGNLKRKKLMKEKPEANDEAKLAREREKERLQRQAKAKIADNPADDYLQQIAALIRQDAPLPEVIVGDEDFLDDDEILLKRQREEQPKPTEVVTLSSDDEDVIICGQVKRSGPAPSPFGALSLGRYSSLSSRGRWGSHHEEAAQENLRQQRAFELKRLRRRRPSGDLESKELTEGKLLVNAGRPEGDPPIYVAAHLTHTLQPHQLAGIRFMYDNVVDSIAEYNKGDGFGCILAHSMGLGKTIQVITFCEIFFRATGAHKVLVITPINTIQNWYAEFHKWMPEFDENGQPLRKFKVYLLGDSVKGLCDRVSVIEKWHKSGGVLLIGYEMFRMILATTKMSSKDKKPQRSRFARSISATLSTISTNSVAGGDSDADEKLDEGVEPRNVEQLVAVAREALIDPGPDLVVCDEGHKIKNLNSATSVALNNIRTKRRVVLTGTPLQNNLIEYFCMVDFVRPAYLGTKKSFIQLFEKPIKNGSCVDSTPYDQKLARQKTHVLSEHLKGFVQRRTHSLLKEILPECREYVLFTRKSVVQRELYKSFILYAKNELDAGNTATFNPLRAFAACSKFWNHPDVLAMWMQKNKEDVKPEADEKPAMLPISSSAMWPVHSFPVLQTFGSWPTISQAPFIEQKPFPVFDSSAFSTTQADAPMSLIPTSSNSLMQQFPHFQPQFSNFPITPAPSPFSQLGQHFGSQMPVATSFSMPSSQSSFLAAPLPLPSEFDRLFSSQQSPPVAQQQQPQFPQHQPTPLFNNNASPPKSSDSTRANSQPSLSSASKETPKRGRQRRALLFEDDLDDGGMPYEWCEAAMRNYATGIVDNGFKMVLALAIIDEATRRGEKILLFSQSLSTLTIIEEFLSRYSVQTADGGAGRWQRNVNYFRFDGTTSGAEREKLISRFNADAAVRLFIITTRAGSLGINLVSANRCIIFDACWNPCHDSQAVCRVYRYGQKQRTFIYRLIMDNSMERAIFNRQISKQGLSQRVVDEVQVSLVAVHAKAQVDANVTQKELETLLVYEESEDVPTGPHDLSQWDPIEDDVLRQVLSDHSSMLASRPILHESLMLESDERLSEEEKREARLLFEQERHREYRQPDYPVGPQPTQYGAPSLAQWRQQQQQQQLNNYVTGLPHRKPTHTYSDYSVLPSSEASNPSSYHSAAENSATRLTPQPSKYRYGAPSSSESHSAESKSNLIAMLQSHAPLPASMFSAPRSREELFTTRCRRLHGVRLIGDALFKDEGEPLIVQQAVLDKDQLLQACSDSPQVELVPAGSRVTLVVNRQGSFLKNLHHGRDGAVYTLQHTQLDLGTYEQYGSYTPPSQAHPSSSRAHPLLSAAITHRAQHPAQKGTPFFRSWPNSAAAAGSSSALQDCIVLD